MLVQCLHHPSIYNKSNLNEDRFQVLLIHLNQLMKNGVLLVDNNGEFISILNKYMKELPNNQRECLYVFISKLATAKKISKIDLKSDKCQQYCENEFCDKFYSIMKISVENCITNNTCLNELSQNTKNEIISLSNYSTSNLYKKLSTTTRMIDSMTNKNTFKKEIIFPIANHSELIKVYDRVLVNSMDDVNGQHIKSNFMNGLEYFLDCIEESEFSDNGKVDIYSSLCFGRNNNNFKQIVKTLKQYIDDLNKKYSFKITITVKDSYNNFPHSRHIITEQIGINIDKGLDLLDNNNKLNSNILSVMNREDIDIIEKCRSLKSLITI